MRLTYSLFIILVTLSACSGDSAEKDQATKFTPINQGESSVTPTNNLAIPDNRFANKYQVLIFGNSHVSGLDNLIEMIFQAGNPDASISIVNAGGGFLDEKSSRQRRSDLLVSKSWTHIILQGQKYSQSGTTTYPTVSAQVWIDKAKSHNITPILFPEHPQKGDTKEGAKVHVIHKGIAALQKSCVAPVGLTWDKVIMTEPRLALHSSDGNHASLMGKLLTAFVFYETITGQAADLLPTISEVTVPESTQQLLKQLASETIQAHPPCKFDT